MTKIIKKDGKFYRQFIEESEVHLESLKENLSDIKARKIERLVKETQDWNNQITEIQDEINQIKSLRNA